MKFLSRENGVLQELIQQQLQQLTQQQQQQQYACGTIFNVLND